MRHSNTTIVRGASWTIASYAVSVIARFGTNIILARLLAPEIFGIMVIVTSVKVGLELVSDLGISHNVVHNGAGGEPAFYNTAWTLQIGRGILLAVACFSLAVPLSAFYGIPDWAIQITAAAMVFTGLTSTSLYLLERKLQLAKRNMFDATVEVVSAVIYVALALISPTVWSLVVGGVIASAIRAGASFLIRDARPSLALHLPYAKEIVSFGKWIFLASLVTFLSMNIDRLFLGKVAPLAILGVYGLARAIAELPAGLAVRLGYLLIFPVISSSKDMPRELLREQIAPLRLKLLAVAALGLSVAVVIADVLIELIYDQRYHEASWMLPLLLLGVWGSVVCSINEATLLGFGRPLYAALGNSVKLVYLIVGLPAAFYGFGLLGAVVIVATSDLPRYVPIVFGQLRERFAFPAQDAGSTLLLAVLVCVWMVLRWHLGFGTSFDDLPVPAPGLAGTIGP